MQGKCSRVVVAIFASAFFLSCSERPPAPPAQLHIASFAPRNAQVGLALRYRASLSRAGEASWTLTSGPSGAVLDSLGVLTWTPSEGQRGKQSFTLSAKLDGETAEQSFDVDVARVTVEAKAAVDPKNPNGGTVSVDAPLSPIRGSAVSIGPGSLPPGGPVDITIGSVENAPVPASAALTGLAAGDLKPVELGPSGLAFARPVSLTLPVSAAVLAKGAPTVLTFDYATSQWHKVPVLAVDAEHGVVVAQASHFSLYVAAPDTQYVDLQLEYGGLGTACESALVVRSPLKLAFSAIPASAVNGLAIPARTVADVLANLRSGDALQVYTRIDATAPDGKTQSGWRLASATRTATGGLKVSVLSDASPAQERLSIPPELSPADAESWMSGSRSESVFGALGPSLAMGARARAEVSFFFVPEPLARVQPPAAANPFGADERQATMLTPTTLADADCDGAPDAWDGQPNGDPPPAIQPMPPGPVRGLVGMPIPLTVAANGSTFAWSSSDPALQLAIDPNGARATATSAIPGFFRVTVTATSGSGQSAFSWDVWVDPPNPTNTPPVVAIAASRAVLHVGETVDLAAVGKDPEQAPSQLTYRWSSAPAAMLTSSSGPVTSFVPGAAGDYTITVVANDGLVDSPPGTLVISVLPANANLPPNPPLVTPMASTLVHGPGEPVSLTITATGSDPDGDPLSYRFTPDPMTPTGATLSQNGPQATLTAIADGVYLLYVNTIDNKGAESPWVPVKVLVTQPLPPAPVDADRDGFPAGIDCDDSNPAIRPGAPEICGDGIDQDCAGGDLPAAQCDADGDRYSPSAGDCDDHNPAVSPGVPERCDLVDNNCNGVIDEGFGVGAACNVGIGACQASGTTRCNATFTGVACSATPGTPAAEVCDGLDNDCNGRVDDVSAQAGGDVSNCGGCNMSCGARPNTAPACVMGGCSYPCVSGYVDTDGAPANGCECRITNGGVEACDGVDNNCNGLVDEGAGQVFYSGPAGTLGIGVCHSGVRSCQGGALVVTQPEQVPTPEVCNGVDDNCDGKVDEGCVAGPADAGVVADMGMCDRGACVGGGGASDMGTAPACAAPFTTCGATCTSLSDDPKHCTSCTSACGAGQVCQASACVPANGTAGSYKQPCATNSDCGPGQICLDSGRTGWTGGFCTYACAEQPCPGANDLCGPLLGPGRPTFCTSKCATDADCGRPGYLCSSGACMPDCRSDGRICGNLGMMCDPMGHCVSAQPPPDGGAGGACVAPFSSCGGSCRLLSDDPQSCMACGMSCGAGQVCQGSVCRPAGAGAIGAGCTQNVDCAAGEFCLDQPRTGWTGGSCSAFCEQQPCPANSVCYPVMGPGTAKACVPRCTGDADCASRPGYLCSQGMCMPDCRSAPQVCTAPKMGLSCDPTGHCVSAPPPADMGGGSSCAPPFTACGAECRLLTDDPKGCGMCGMTCSASQVCQASTCVAAGTEAFGAACAQSSDCSPGATCLDQGRTGFTGGYCSVLCQSSAECAATAVCFPIMGPSAEGACLQKCAADADCARPGYVCNSGACMPSCTTSPMVCANLKNGSTCDATGHCTTTGGGGCGAGQTQCPTGCVSTATDPMNCGSCGRACSGGQVCMNGMCQTGSSCMPMSTRSCYSGTPDTLGKGRCVGGVQHCMPNGQWEPACPGEILPAPEQCGNFVDDDCDNVVDDGCPLALGPSGVTVLAGDTYVLRVSGGTPPYTFSLESAPSGGSIAASGAYTAGATPATDIVRVTDAVAATVTLPVGVVSTPQVTLTPPSANGNMPLVKVQIRSTVNATLSATLDGVSQPVTPIQADGTASVDVMAMPPMSMTRVLVVTAQIGAQTGQAMGSYTFDFTPPGAPAITAPTSGATVAGPNVTVTGTADADAASVQIFEGPMVIGSGMVAGGAFTVDVPNLKTGQHTITAKVADAAGNTSSASPSVLFTLTGGAPGPLAANPAGPTTTSSSLVLTATGGTPPYTWAFVTNATGGTLGSDGSYTAGATPGTDVVQVTDSASATANLSIVVNPPPFVAIVSPSSGALLSTTTVQVSAHTNVPSPATIELWVDAAPRQMMPTNAMGDVTMTVTLFPGPHQLQARVPGQQPAVTSALVDITIDTTPPAITILSPTTGAQVSPPFTVSGTTEPNRPVSVLVDGIVAGSTTSDGAGAFSVEVMQSLASGPHTIAANTTDLAGNPGTTSVSVTAP